MNTLSSRRHWLIAAGTSVFLGFLIFQKYFLTGALPFFGESSGMADPMAYYIMEGLKLHHIPLWNSHVFGGIPTYMDGYSQPFSPFHWIGLIIAFPGVQIWKAVLMLFLAGFGGFGFLYKGLRLTPQAALFGSIGFLLSPLVVQFPDGHIMYQPVFVGYALLPATLWALTHVLQGESWSERRWGMVGAALSVTTVILSTHLNVLLWYVVYVGAYCVWLLYGSTDKTKGLIALAIAAGVTALLSAPAILGWHDSLPLSWRMFMSEHISEYPFARLGIKKEALSGLFYQVHSRHGMGSLHTGFPIAFLGLLAAFLPKRKEELYFRVWLLFAVFLIALNLAPISWNAKLLYPIAVSPNIFRRGLFMVVTSLTVLASLRFDFYMREKRVSWSELYAPTCKIIALMILAAAGYFIWRGSHIAIIKKITPAGWALAWTLTAICWYMSRRPVPLKMIGAFWEGPKRLGHYVWLIPVFFLAVEQIYFINHRERDEVRNYSLFYHPVQHNRHVFDRDALIERIQHTGDYYRTAIYQPNLPTDDLYENLFLIRWAENLSIMNRWYNYTGWLSDFPAGYYAYFRKHFPGSDRYGRVQWDTVDPMLTEAGKAISTGWIVTTEKLKNPVFQKVAEQPPLLLYRNPAAYPRVFTMAESESSAWAELKAKHYVVEPADAFHDDGDRVELSVSPREASTLVMTDTWYPGWKAFVDNQETEIRPIRDTFRAISIPAGVQKVRLVFEPAFMKPALFLVGVGVCCLLILFFIPLSLRRNSL